MRKLTKWLQAFKSYINTSKYKYWYRASTNQWVLEVVTDIPEDFYQTSRYPCKVKWLCWTVWLWYFWGSVKDIYKCTNN